MAINDFEVQKLNEILVDLQRYHLLTLGRFGQGQLKGLFESYDPDSGEQDRLAADTKRLLDLKNAGLGDRVDYDLTLLIDEFMDIAYLKLMDMGGENDAGELWIQVLYLLKGEYSQCYKTSKRRGLPKLLFIEGLDPDLKWIRSNILNTIRSEERQQERKFAVSIDNDEDDRENPILSLLADEIYQDELREGTQQDVLELVSNMFQDIQACLPEDIQYIANCIEEDMKLGLFKINTNQIAIRHYSKEPNAYNKAAKDINALRDFLKNRIEEIC
jgi:hypothetical protein